MLLEFWFATYANIPDGSTTTETGYIPAVIVRVSYCDGLIGRCDLEGCQRLGRRIALSIATAYGQDYCDDREEH